MTTNIGFNVGGKITIEVIEPKPDLTPRFTAHYGGFTVTGEGNMAYTLPVDMSIGIAVTYADREGNVVDLPQGNVAWESSDETILKIVVQPDDDQRARMVPGGTLGNAQVTCTGTNPSGSKVIATLDVTIVAGDAITGTIQPEGQPEPLPPT